jgi:hypothetical protein
VSKLKIEVNPAFLASFNRLSIATSPNEAGEIIEKGKHRVNYLVSENTDGTFDLKAYIKTLEGGLREMNTEITLTESEWIVIGGLTRQADDGNPLIYSTAIRISPRVSQAR